MDKRWVLNASPVILLAKAGVVHLVPRLCEQLVIPEGTMQEVLRGKMSDDGRAWLNAGGATYIRPSAQIPDTITRLGLGTGESQVLAWVLANPGFEGVLDDFQARRAANTLRLPIVGSLRVLIILKERGLIPAIKPAVTKFREAGSYLSDDLVEQALKLAGEQ